MDRDQGNREQDIPQEITVDAANRPHFTDLRAQTNNLDAHVSALFDDNVGVVGELRRGGAGVVLDLIGHQLGETVSQGFERGRGRLMA